MENESVSIRLHVDKRTHFCVVASLIVLLWLLLWGAMVNRKPVLPSPSPSLTPSVPQDTPPGYDALETSAAETRADALRQYEQMRKQGRTVRK